MRSSPIRYMGTKVRLAQHVRDIILGLNTTGRVADLFSGMGSVANALAPERHVLINDVSPFTSAMARVRFLGTSRTNVRAIARDLRGSYRQAFAELVSAHRPSIEAEREAMRAGRARLLEHFETAPHPGNSTNAAAAAKGAQAAQGVAHYQMAALYFGGGYFSTEQATALDALRFAIDSLENGDARARAIAAWLATAGALINSPGHTAQFLKPTTDQMVARIAAKWRRDPWQLFTKKLAGTQPVGTATWRRGNAVTCSDATALVGLDDFRGVGLAYADPPYTKDHYSRFYHVYESMFLYDFPVITGIGRYRADRHVGEFGLGTGVVAAFKGMFQALASRGIPLVLSYPESGLLHEQSASIADVAAPAMRIEAIYRQPTAHSTMGASKGVATKQVTELIYVCRPA